jgi:cell wall-associated NlpC family hydrolase
MRAIKYDHLRGKEWDQDHQHCYTTLRDFYSHNFDIELTDYPNPTNWWKSGLDLYTTLSDREGFYLIGNHPKDWQTGDVIVMALDSSVGCHVAVVLDNGKILHHVYGHRSTVGTYGGRWRNNTVAVYRHKDVPEWVNQGSTLDIGNLLGAKLQQGTAS